MQIGCYKFLLITLASLTPLVANAANVAATTCIAQSGAKRAVLLELYTSEGCDSCPPADKWLSQQKSRPAASPDSSALVPLAFHVDYWDSLGWKDRFANAEYTRRQQTQVARANGKFSYTPQFIRNGQDWRRNDRVLGSAEAAAANISIDFALPKTGALIVNAKVQSLTPNPTQTQTQTVWLAIYEHNLESIVNAGENKGETLHHDYVVRKFIGPVPLPADGKMTIGQPITPDDTWMRSNLGVAVVVQDAKTGEVLQALARHNCFN